MAFLEAMARGSVVLAHDAPTMNEYIEHGRNGILLKRHWTLRRFQQAIRGRLSHMSIGKHPDFDWPIPERQNWSEFASMHLEKLGEAARQDHEHGYNEWSKQLSTYANFVCSS